jgi:hypothetical protein
MRVARQRPPWKQLTKVEEVKAMARRKEIYLSLHPETGTGKAPGKKGGKGGKGKKTESVSLPPSIDMPERKALG